MLPRNNSTYHILRDAAKLVEGNDVFEDHLTRILEGIAEPEGHNEIERTGTFERLKFEASSSWQLVPVPMVEFT